MSASLAADLDALRGFGDHWSEGASAGDERTPLEALVPDAEPLGAQAEAEHLQAMVVREARLFLDVLQTVEGQRAWELWIASAEARARNDTPPADLSALAGTSSPPLRRVVSDLQELGVKRVHRALFLRHVRRHDAELAVAFRNQFDALDQARIPLVLRNLKLAIWSTTIPSFSSRENLLYGTIGVANAVDRFELDRGRVSTYASSWIRARKSRASANWVESLRDPGYLIEQRMKVRAIAGAARETGGEATIPEVLAGVDGLERRRVVELYRRRALGERLGTDGVGGAQRLLDLSRDEPIRDPARHARLQRAWSLVQDALRHSRDHRKRFIVECRLGLHPGTETLAAVGQKLGLSRERVRQIEKEAFVSIRHFVRLEDERDDQGAGGGPPA